MVRTRNISTAVLSNYMNGITKEPKVGLIYHIIREYPEYNIYWVLTGNGEKLLTEEKQEKVARPETEQERTIRLLRMSNKLMEQLIEQNCRNFSMSLTANNVRLS